VSGVVLLVSMWGAKRSGTTLDPTKEMQDVRKCMKLLEVAEARWTVAGRLRCVLHNAVLFKPTDYRRHSDLLTDLTAAGELTVPADSPPSNKREREDSDDERSPLPSTPQVQTQPHRSASLGSTPHPPVLTAKAGISPVRAPTGPGAEFTPPLITAPQSSLAPSAAVKQEVQSDMFGYLVPPAPSNKVASTLVPKPYSGSYVPLYGSSGLGRATTATQSSSPTPAPPASPFGSTRTAGYSPPPMMYENSNAALSMSTGPGRAQPPGISMTLASGGLYDATTPTPPSGPTSISSNSSSPYNGFQPGIDFGTGAGGVFDMNGMEMEFGGYGVPTADKEAMMRHFAPVLLQDGQIDVDKDTMMMWSNMPSTYECVSFVLFSLR